MAIRVSLDRYLRRHNISPYRLAQETRGRVARSVYPLARGEQVKHVDLETLGDVLEALERITGERVNLSDLLEREDASIERKLEPALSAVLERAKPFNWEEIKQFTDPEAEPFDSVRPPAEDRLGRLGRLWNELDAGQDVKG